MAAQGEHTTWAATSQEEGRSSASREVLGPDPALILSSDDVVRFSPFALIRRILDELDGIAREIGLSRSGRNTIAWTPAVEITESEGEYHFRAAVPGLTPEKVLWEATNNSLVIAGEGHIDKKVEREDARLTDRQREHFFRTIPLPEGTNPDQAQAFFRKGVLEVTIPIRKRASQPQSIHVETDSSALNA